MDEDGGEDEDENRRSPSRTTSLIDDSARSHPKPCWMANEVGGSVKKWALQHRKACMNHERAQNKSSTTYHSQQRVGMHGID